MAEHLPSDLLAHIFSFCGSITHVHCTLPLVQKRWKHIIYTHPTLWELWLKNEPFWFGTPFIVLKPQVYLKHHPKYKQTDITQIEKTNPTIYRDIYFNLLQAQKNWDLGISTSTQISKEKHHQPIGTVHFDGYNQLLSACRQGIVKLWDTDHNLYLKDSFDVKMQIIHSQFSRFGDFFFCSNNDTMMSIWDVKAHQEMKQLEGTFGNFQVDEDSRLVLTAADPNYHLYERKVKLWDFPSLEPIHDFQHQEKVLQIALHQNQIITSTANHFLHWDARTKALVRKFIHPHQLSAHKLFFDGKRIVSISCNAGIWILRVLDMETYIVQEKDLNRPKDLVGRTNFKVWSSFLEGRKLLIGYESVIDCWDVANINLGVISCLSLGSSAVPFALSSYQSKLFCGLSFGKVQMSTF